MIIWRVNGYKSARVISAAEELKIFKILDRAPQNITVIAEKAEINEDKIEPILNALVCIGLVEKVEGGFYLGDYYDVLNENTPNTQCGYIRHATTMMNKWRDLAKAAKFSEVKKENFEAITGEEKKSTQAFIQAMNANALSQAKFLVGKYNFDNHRILDIGAGAGTYCIEVGKRYPSTSGVLMDLPVVCEIINENLNKNQLNERFKTYAQNYNEKLAEGIYDDN